jgi:hypothetical protein
MAPSLDLLDVVVKPGIRERGECQLRNVPGWKERGQDERASFLAHGSLGKAKDRVTLRLFHSLHVELLAIKQQL